MPLQINYNENMLIVLTTRNVNFFKFNIAVKLLQPMYKISDEVLQSQYK